MDIELKAFLLKQNERWEKMLPKTHIICEKWDDIIAVFDSDIGLLNFNNCPKLRVVFHFGMICADQIFDIAVLIQNESFSSIENILRAVLESYGIFDLLMRHYTNDTTFIIINEYLKLLDLEQNFKILSAESKDTTSIKYKEGKIIPIKSYITNLIDWTFPAEKTNLKTDSDKDFIDSVRQIIDRLKGKNPKARTKFHSIPGLHPYIHGKIVEQALINNQAWKAKTGTTYDGAGYIYNALCRATHSNISSVIQRLDAVDGITVPNTLTPNTERCLTLAYTIIEDIYNKLKPLFTKT